MRKQEKWNEKTVHQLLANPMYAGIGPLPSGILPAVPRMVDDEMWVKVQGQLIEEAGTRQHLITVRRSLHNALGKKVAAIAYPSWLDESVAKIEQDGADNFFHHLLIQLRPQTKALELIENKVQVVDITPQLLHSLAANENEIFKLTPSVFEQLVCERLYQMGFGVQLVGRNTFHKDGGIDIVAWPKTSNFPFLMAVQAKYHYSDEQKTSSDSIRDLLGVVSSLPFHAGIIVTNTTFTPDAHWMGRQQSKFVRLRDITDIKRWLAGDFLNEFDWREMPDEIEVRPGVTVKIPKP